MALSSNKGKLAREKINGAVAIQLSVDVTNVHVVLHLHLSDTFIQSDLQCYTFVLSVCVIPGNQTHNLCAADAML